MGYQSIAWENVHTHSHTGLLSPACMFFRKWAETGGNPRGRTGRTYLETQTRTVNWAQDLMRTLELWDSNSTHCATLPRRSPKTNLKQMIILQKNLKNAKKNANYSEMISVFRGSRQMRPDPDIFGLEHHRIRKKHCKIWWWIIGATGSPDILMHSTKCLGLMRLDTSQKPGWLFQEVKTWLRMALSTWNHKHAPGSTQKLYAKSKKLKKASLLLSC